jgi:hypothetical protein
MPCVRCRCRCPVPSACCLGLGKAQLHRAANVLLRYTGSGVTAGGQIIFRWWVLLNPGSGGVGAAAATA